MGIIYTQERGTSEAKMRVYTPPPNPPPRSPHTDNLTIASDSAFANDQVDRRSIAGAIITLNSSPVALFSRKHQPVAISTADAEYSAITMALQVVTLMHSILKSMPFMADMFKTDSLTNNMPALNMLFSLGGTKMSKFIDLRHYYIREQIQRYDISYAHVPTDKMKADIIYFYVLNP